MNLIEIKELLSENSGTLLAIVAIIMTLIQVTPIKVNPWSAIGKLFKTIWKAIGKAFNGDVIERLDRIESTQIETQKRLDQIESTQLDTKERLDKIEETQTETKEHLAEHIRTDDERNADLHRSSILQFNEELIGGIPHTEERFNEVLCNIDYYERYCEEHPEYPNNKAVRAIKNIKRVYDERMEKHDFL